MKKKISVIVPIYNVEKYLEKCILSIVNQTYRNIEIILINDGSGDSCEQICKKWQKKDSRIIYKKKKNGGLSSARNAGIDIASGDYICFIDSDDFLDEKALLSMMEKVEKYNADVVICNRYYYYESGKKLLKYKKIEEDLIMNSELAIKEMNSYKSFDMAAWAKLYDIKLFNNIRFPEGKICEDFYIMYQLFDLANKIVYFSEPLYYYLQRDGSITKNQKIRYDFIIAAENQMNFVEQKYPSLKKCVRTAYASAIMTVYSQVIKNGGRCSTEVIKDFQEKVKENVSFVYFNKDIFFLKKIQTFLFANCIFLYDFLYRIFRLIKKV